MLCEALIRWKHPDRGLIMPDRFISLAEENGLIVEIGDWVLRESCRQARQWQRIAGCEDIGVTVNLSMRQLQDPRLDQLADERADRSRHRTPGAWCWRSPSRCWHVTPSRAQACSIR